MKLRPEQLKAHSHQKLLPIYIISGDEPLLIQESTADVIQAAKIQNYSEHTIHQIHAQFDWEKFLMDAFTLSLFSTKSIIELRFPGQPPNAAAAKALQTYVEHSPPHKILLIITEKLESATQKSAWFKALDNCGAFIQIWPIERQQLPNWISIRARQRGLKLDSSSLTALTDRVEGNLIAATQTLDRLTLIAKEGFVSTDQIHQTVIDQARFTIFDFIDALLESNLKRAYRILYFLKEEGAEPLFILNMITKDIRLIARLSHNIQEGMSIEQSLKTVYLPPKKQLLLRRLLPRFSIKTCQILLHKALKVDQVLKGAEKGNGWQMLSEFCLSFTPP